MCNELRNRNIVGIPRGDSPCYVLHQFTGRIPAQPAVVTFGRDAPSVPIVLEEDEVPVSNTQRGFTQSLAIRPGRLLRSPASRRTGVVASLAAVALLATACGSSSTPASSSSSSAAASAPAASAPAASAPAASAPAASAPAASAPAGSASAGS